MTRPDDKTLLREAIVMLEREREILFHSFSVRLPTHPGYGQVVDEPERSQLEDLDTWLKHAKAAVA